MTAPGEDGETDSDRESTDEETDSRSPLADSVDEGVGTGSGEREETVSETESEPDVTEGNSVSTAVTAHQQDRDTRRPPAVGRNESAGDDDDDEQATWKLFTRDVVVSVAAVALLGMYLFAISGVWPPMVAIESGSMEPNMEIDDLVFLMDNERFAPEEAHPGTGVVTAAVGNETGYGNYGESGDVIVFEPDGDSQKTPIIHRAMFWVEEGENWCEQADPAYLRGLDTDNERCIAPNDGFITKGDNNGRYDQASLQAERPVKPEWVVGIAEVRIPRLGWFRLQFQTSEGS